MRIEEVCLVRVAMPLVRPFRTSFGVQEVRDVLLVHVVADVGEGWGECAAHAELFYDEEFPESAALVLERWLVPTMPGVTADRDALADLGTTVRTTIDGRTPGGTRPFQETR